MKLQPGNTCLLAMMNGGFYNQCVDMIAEFAPSLIKLCGEDMIIVSADTGVRTASKIGKLPANVKAGSFPSEAERNELFSIFRGGGGTDITTSLTELATLDSVKDVENIIMFSSLLSVNKYIGGDAPFDWLCKRNILIVTPEGDLEYARRAVKQFPSSFNVKLIHPFQFQFLLMTQ